MIRTLFITVFYFSLSACSTTTTFRIPEGATLTVYDRPVVTDSYGRWKTRPFGWAGTTGATYRLEKDNKVIDSGTLSTKFRPASIFWPPFGITYWPMGFRFPIYDFESGKDPGVRSDLKAPSQKSAAQASDDDVDAVPPVS